MTNRQILLDVIHLILFIGAGIMLIILSLMIIFRDADWMCKLKLRTGTQTSACKYIKIDEVSLVNRWCNFAEGALKNQGQAIEVNINSMDSSHIGTAGEDRSVGALTTQAGADAAITTINDAKEYFSNSGRTLVFY